MRRRDVLVGAGRGVLGLALVAVTASACGGDREPEVDPLQAALEEAWADAELARRATKAAPPALLPALNQIATERSAHAEALAEEIGRTRRGPAPTTSSTEAAPSSTDAAGASTTPAPPPPSSADVVKALTASAETAAELAARQSGYRAGLLGSIAAACTASATVTLPAPKAS